MWQISAAFVDVSPEELLQSDPSYLKESIKASPVETQSVKEVSTWHVRKQLLYYSMMLLLKYHLVLLEGSIKWTC